MQSYCRFLALAASCFFASNLPSFSEEDPLFRVVPIEDTTGFEVGRGYDILKDTPRGDCVDRSIIQNHPNFGPSNVSFRSTKVENSTELDRALGLSASASVRGLSWGGDASASFSSTLAVSTYELAYVVDVQVSSKGDSIRDVKLKESYQKLIADGKDQSLERFRAICGDGYIGEFTMGGRFQAIIQVQVNSKSESEATAASLSASLGMASGASSFSSTLKRAEKSNRVSIYIVQRGGSGPIPIGPDELTARAAALPDNVRASAAPIQAAVFSYITLMEDPNIPLIDLAGRENALNTLRSKAQSARTQQADAQYIFDHPSQFYSHPTDLPLLAAEINGLVDYRKALAARAQNCIRDAGSCESVDLPMPAPTARPAWR